MWRLRCWISANQCCKHPSPACWPRSWSLRGGIPNQRNWAASGDSEGPCPSCKYSLMMINVLNRNILNGKGLHYKYTMDPHGLTTYFPLRGWKVPRQEANGRCGQPQCTSWPPSRNFIPASSMVPSTSFVPLWLRRKKRFPMSRSEVSDPIESFESRHSMGHKMSLDSFLGRIQMCLVCWPIVGEFLSRDSRCNSDSLKHHFSWWSQYNSQTQNIKNQIKIVSYSADHIALISMFVFPRIFWALGAFAERPMSRSLWDNSLCCCGCCIWWRELSTWKGHLGRQLSNWTKNLADVSPLISNWVSNLWHFFFSNQFNKPSNWLITHSCNGISFLTVGYSVGFSKPFRLQALADFPQIPYFVGHRWRLGPKTRKRKASGKVTETMICEKLWKTDVWWKPRSGLSNGSSLDSKRLICVSTQRFLALLNRCRLSMRLLHLKKSSISMSEVIRRCKRFENIRVQVQGRLMELDQRRAAVRGPAVPLALSMQEEEEEEEVSKPKECPGTELSQFFLEKSIFWGWMFGDDVRVLGYVRKVGRSCWEDYNQASEEFGCGGRSYLDRKQRTMVEFLHDQHGILYWTS